VTDGCSVPLVSSASNLWPALLGALPTATAALRALVPAERNSLVRHIRRLSALREHLPDGPGREALDQTLDHLGSELAYKVDRRARRRVKGVSVAALVVIVVVAGGAAWALWAWGLWAKVLAVLLAVLSALLVLGGSLDVFEVRGFDFEQDASTPDAAETTQPGRS